MDAAKVMLGFRDLSVVDNRSTPKLLLGSVSGYVEKGGMTIIVGPSSSGKSLLLKTLAGRALGIRQSGEVTYDGAPLEQQRKSAKVYFEEDLLVGVLRVKETLMTSLRLRENLTKEQAEEKVDFVISSLGLAEVAKNRIGTVLQRGLSGGQQRRCSVAIELLNTSGALLLDEPTSGLDAATAVTVMEFIQKLVRGSNGALSAMVILQQPNLRLLETCDHLLVLARGGMSFFGTLADSKAYFGSIGYPLASGDTPSDHYLAVADEGNENTKDFDFGANFQSSVYGNQLAKVLSKASTAKLDDDSQEAFGFDDNKKSFETSFFRQFWALLKRNLTIGYRDPTLYYLQLVLHSFYGFLVGATFWMLPSNIDFRLNDYFSGITWLVFINSYIHVFKAHYLVQSNRLFHHERQNKAYSVLAHWTSELLSTLFSVVVFLPGGAIAYFMMDFDAAAFGFCLLTLYVCAVAAEGIVHLMSQLTRNSATAVVLAQTAMIVLSVFTGGTLITENEIPPWWEWFGELSFFAQCARALQTAIFAEATYTCPLESITAAGTCDVPARGLSFPCDVEFTAGTSCSVAGDSVLSIYKSGGGTDKWLSLLYLFLLVVLEKLLVLFLYYYPIEFLQSRWRKWRQGEAVNMITQSFVETKRLDGQVKLLQEKTDNLQEKRVAARTIQRFWRRVRVNPIDSNDNSRKSQIRRRSTAAGAKSLVWNNLKLTLPNGKVLIDSVTGEAKAGRALALMGPSGAGKTTLLNALSGRATYAKVTGSVLFDGHPMSKNELDFVPQFDEFDESFTVQEILMNAAELKAKKTDNPNELRRHVSKLLKILGLSYVAHMHPCQLTGGQRKRVSIGIGLCGQPQVLFLDEPTTGLDSSAAENIIQYMSKVARETNVVIVVTIHQPAASVFATLDDLYLLERGRLAFFGLIQDAVVHFAQQGFVCHEGCNPADYYLELVSQSPAESVPLGTGDPKSLEGVTWKDLYLRSEQCIMPDTPKQSQVPKPQHVSEMTRFWILLRRCFQSNIRSPLYYMRTIQLFVLALFLGTLFLRLDQSTSLLTELSGAAFFNIWVVLFCVVAGAPIYSVDRRIVQQQHVNGSYKIFTHVCAQFLASLPFNLIAAVIYQGAFHWLVGFNDTFEAYIYAVFVSWELMVLMEAIVLCVVEGLKEAMLSVTFSMILLGFLFLFSTFFISMSSMPPSISWIPWMVPSFYALEGSLDNIFSGQTYTSGAQTVSGDLLLEDVFNQELDINKWVLFVIVFAWAIFYHGVHYCLVLFTNRKYGKVHNTESKASGVNGGADPGYAHELTEVKAADVDASLPSDIVTASV